MEGSVISIADDFKDDEKTLYRYASILLGRLLDEDYYYSGSEIRIRCVESHADAVKLICSARETLAKIRALPSDE